MLRIARNFRPAAAMLMWLSLFGAAWFGLAVIVTMMSENYDAVWRMFR